MHGHLKLGNFALFRLIFWDCIVEHEKRLSKIVGALLAIILTLFGFFKKCLDALDLLIICFVVQVNLFAVVLAAAQYFLNVLFPLSLVLFAFEGLFFCVQLILLHDAIPFITLHLLALLCNLCKVRFLKGFRVKNFQNLSCN